MPRLRGPAPNLPQGDAAWPILNEGLFGDQARGGHDRAPRPDAVPVDWRAVFGREAPRTLEIGFNRGRFLRDLAARWPDHDHVGIEVRRSYAWRVAELMARDGGPRNVRLVWADAKLVVPATFGPDGLAHVFVNFPDPWWKRRHEKRRLVDLDFARTLADRVAPGGRIWIKSDVLAIADEIAEALAAVPSLGPPVPFDVGDLPLTHRERACLVTGLPISRYAVTRGA